MSSLEEYVQKKVFKYIEDNRMLEGIENVIVGLSGGADSVCLLLLLDEYCKAHGIMLTAVHVQHGIRGEAAISDAIFCENLCKQKNIFFARYDIDVPDIAARNRMSLEEAGRTERYRIFDEHKRIVNNSVIAVAHHANDQAETMIHNVIRGSFLKGARGMLPNANGVIRPLLECTRSEIEDYLKSVNQDYCTDCTNLTDDYCRNKIRHNIIPVMTEINSESVLNICRFTKNMAALEDYIAIQVEKAKLIHLKNQNNEEILQGELFIADTLLEEHEIIKNALVYDVLGDLCGRRNLTSTHVQCMLGLFDLQCGRRLELHNGVKARRTYGGIILSDKSSNNLLHLNESVKTNNDAIRIGDKPVYYMKIKPREYFAEDFIRNLTKNSQTDYYTKLFDYGKIREYILSIGTSSDIRLRHRMKGDYMVIDRLGHKKKVKQILIDCKIPLEKRDKLWMFAIDNNVLWIIGVRDSMGFLIDDNTNEILQINVEENK